MHVRGPGTCQARFCSFAQGSSAHFLSVAISLMDSCEFYGGDSASVTVEGQPVTERNWACKHLSALAKMLTAATVSCQDAKDNIGGVSPRDSAPEDWTKQDMDWETGWTKAKPLNEGLLSGQEGTMIEDESMDTSSDSGDEEKIENGSNGGYTLSYEQHGLAHLLEPGKPDFSMFPVLLSLSAELQRDPEAQELANSVQGCLLRHCLLRDGKGGVHLCNHGQARLEANMFRGLNYAVRCIQYAKVSWKGKRQPLS